MERELNAREMLDIYVGLKFITTILPNIVIGIICFWGAGGILTWAIETTIFSKVDYATYGFVKEYVLPLSLPAITIFSLIKNFLMTFEKNPKKIKINTYFNYLDDGILLLGTIGIWIIFFAIYKAFIVSIFPLIGGILYTIAFCISIYWNQEIIRKCKEESLATESLDKCGIE